ncbi:GNAT family N-acetyltransferase [Mesobacillus selenatarsenatis]|uniref:Acetyltransferase, GNAT family n=1 Tax=Mesobacillus selenatarsenatis (strain DSM 18680 / JCM 14380 / FERM P-15431 / SF-1) TaxID=1321606 RepID=A0A0A8X4I1_MESS1|nr:GNAT family N-acetyltransferase [Mesobacillus selenatarsenatis]GAM13051.1 acetyltransferase, GNAT family [Mesobacillus selenatarsenatis SF-1]
MSFNYAEEDGRFVAKDSDGLEVGEVTYTRDGNKFLVINHTGVDPANRGQGVAEELVRQVVEKAKNEDLKVEPICSFAQKEFERKPEYKEVLKQ